MKKRFWDRLFRISGILLLVGSLISGAAGAYLLGSFFGMGMPGYPLGFLVGFGLAGGAIVIDFD